MAAVTLAILLVALCGCALLLVGLSRAGYRSATAPPLRFAVVAIMVWITINLNIVLTEPDDPAFVAMWGLPAAAAVAAGATAVASALVIPRWRMSVSTWSLLSIHPTVMLVCAIVPPWQHLIYTTAEDGSVEYGPIVYLHSAAMVLLIVGALVRVMRVRHRLPAIAAMSGWMIALSWLAPLVGAAFSLARSVPAGVDITSAGAAVAAIMLWIGALRPGLLELQPIARDWVFDKLHDAVFVVGVDGVLVDANDRARQLLDSQGIDPDTPHVNIRDAFPEFSNALESTDVAGAEYELAGRAHPLIAWVTVTPMERQPGALLGSLVQVRDITETALHHRENESMRLALEAESRVNEKLRVELSEQVMRDPATGLRNRRFVSANVPAMMLRASAEGAPLSILMVDIDHFKQINDDYGHSVGDRVIAAVASALSEGAPADAEVVRFGGEEFLVVLPGVNARDAFDTAESLRAACAALAVPTRDGRVTLRVSAGVATATGAHEGADHLIDDADRALYAAKQAGRDRTEMWRSDIADETV